MILQSFSHTSLILQSSRGAEGELLFDFCAPARISAIICFGKTTVGIIVTRQTEKVKSEETDPAYRSICFFSPLGSIIHWSCHRTMARCPAKVLRKNNKKDDDIMHVYNTINNKFSFGPRAGKGGKNHGQTKARHNYKYIGDG